MPKTTTIPLPLRLIAVLAPTRSACPRRHNKAIARTTITQVNLYPHHSALRAAICRSLPGAALTPPKRPADGRFYRGITLVNTAFLQDNAQVLGVCPQFSDYMSNARLLGYDYQAIPLDAKAGYRFVPDAMLNAIHPGLSLIYIDNPNNPTGQIIPLDALRSIAEKARKCGACVVIDEAYGGFMPPETSAATLLRQLDNVIVLRTFSKGWGLAGLRAGYLLAAEELVAAIGKLSNPYVISEPARLIAERPRWEIPAFFLPAGTVSPPVRDGCWPACTAVCALQSRATLFLFACSSIRTVTAIWRQCWPHRAWGLYRAATLWGLPPTALACGCPHLHSWMRLWISWKR